MTFNPALRFCSLLAAACCCLQADTVTLSQIYVSVGPDGHTSPSYAAYTANAQAGVVAGGTSMAASIQNTPSAYNVVSVGTNAALSGSSITNSPFPSWLGKADPAGVLAAEQGNMAYWSIDFKGTNISLSNITVTQMSTDPLDYFGDPSQAGGLFTFSFAGHNYGTDFVGVTAGGTRITSGAGTTPVNEIIITGFGAAQDGYGFNFPGTDAEQLQQINNAFFDALGTYAINTCYYYGAAVNTNPSSCDSSTVTNVLISNVPEPSTFSSVVLALAIMPLAWMFRRLGRA